MQQQQYARPPFQGYPASIPYGYPPATGNPQNYPYQPQQPQQSPLINSNPSGNLEQQTQMLQIRTVSAELENQGNPVAPPAEAMKEVKLINNNKEREMYDNLADLYAIIKTLEHLEKAFFSRCNFIY